MIRNNQFIKRKIGAQYVIVALGEATRRFTGMITVNETGSLGSVGALLYDRRIGEGPDRSL